MKNRYQFKLKNLFPMTAHIMSIALAVPSASASQSSMVEEASTTETVGKMVLKPGCSLYQHFSRRICEQLNHSAETSSADSHEPTVLDSSMLVEVIQLMLPLGYLDLVNKSRIHRSFPTPVPDLNSR